MAAPERAYRCRYTAGWVVVKVEWDAAADVAEPGFFARAPHFVAASTAAHQHPTETLPAMATQKSSADFDRTSPHAGNNIEDATASPEASRSQKPPRLAIAS